MPKQTITPPPKQRLYVVELPFTIIDPVKYQDTLSAIHYSYDYIIELLIIAYVNSVLLDYDAEDYIEDSIHNECSYDADPYDTHDLKAINHDIESTMAHEMITMYHQAFDLFEYEFSMLDRVDIIEMVSIDVNIDYNIIVILVLE